MEKGSTRCFLYGLVYGGLLNVAVIGGIGIFLNPSLLNSGNILGMAPVIIFLVILSEIIFFFAYMGWKWVFRLTLIGSTAGCAAMLVVWGRGVDHQWGSVVGLLYFFAFLLAGLVLGVGMQSMKVLSDVKREQLLKEERKKKKK